MGDRPVGKRPWCRIKQSPRRRTKAAHQLSRVRPQAGTERFGIRLVIMTAEHRVVPSGLRQAARYIGVVVEGDLEAGNVEFRKLTVKRDVVVLRRDRCQEMGVAVVVAEHRIHGSGELPRRSARV